MSDLTHMKRDPQAETMRDLNSKPEEYPYGLCLRLTEADLEKLGIDMPAVGQMIHINAMSKVTSCHASDSASGSASQSVELQITHMNAEVEDEEDQEEVTDKRTPAEKIYGKK